MMICKVRETILKYNMLSRGDRVTVGLSGGADSSALLLCLLELKDEFGIEVSAAHVNHCLRGEESDSDERFVRDLCENLGVPLEVLRADVSTKAAQSGEGLEECGRRIRYDFFKSLGTTVATAHNLNDVCETFLFNFSRGAGLRGLTSIPPVRDNIVRPLIECSRAEIEEYCREKEIDFVTDSTNSDVDYSRNRIRHMVIPELKRINASLETSALRCIDSLREDDEFLHSMAEELVEKSSLDKGFSTEILNEAHISLRKRALSSIVYGKTGEKTDSDTLKRLVDLLKTGGLLQISGGFFVRVSGSPAILSFPVFKDIEDWENCDIILEDGISVNLPFSSVEIEIFNNTDINKLQNVNNKLLEYRLDCDKIHGNVCFRSRRPGDAFAPAGRGCTKSLKKLFNEAAVEPELRPSFTVCEDEEGIIFVEDFGVDRRCAVSASTKRILKIRLRRI